MSFLTRAFVTDVFPEADAPAMPITWRVNHGGLYSGLSLITPTTTRNVGKGNFDYHFSDDNCAFDPLTEIQD